MCQEIHNNNPVDTQINISSNNGPIDLVSKKTTRWQRRFQQLKEAIEKNETSNDFTKEFEEYNSHSTGKSMPEKLEDGNFSQSDISKAKKYKQQYWKKLEKSRFYEPAQKIDCAIFSKIIMDFDTYIVPLIENESSKAEIIQALTEKIINPILTILNEEGYDDDFLDYNANHILGMVYFLTGKCYLNWKNYDNL